MSWSRNWQAKYRPLDLRVGLATLLKLQITHYLDRMDDLLERQIAMMASK